jgi:amidase
MWFSAGKDTWKLKAEAKARATMDKITEEWRLPKAELDKAAEQRDITGPFIQQYLQSCEREIITEEATTLVAKLQKGLLTAREVTLAFCKTAAIAHQIVRAIFMLLMFQTDSSAE